MHMKRNIYIFLALSVVGFVSSYLVLGSDLQVGSVGDSLVRFGKVFFYGSGALALVFLILLFVPRAFPAWKKFAVWFIPLAALLFAIYPEPGSGDLFSPYPEQIFRWVSAFYILASVFIIALSSLRQPRHE